MSPCSQPQNSVSAASRPTLPSCHQKFGTVTNPRQSQSLGASRDNTRADVKSSRVNGAQAPRPRNDQVFFQSTAHSHQANQASSSDHCRPSASNPTSNLRKT